MTDEIITPAQLQWLIDCGRELLARLGETAPSRFEVRQPEFGELESWQQSLLQQQRQLRWRCRSRFPRPDLWLWTERSLAQASDYWSAHYKAGLFPKDQLVVDACCGAGADLVALAGRGEVIGIDCDPGLSRLAEDNARSHGFQVQVKSQTLSSAWQGTGDWLSIDPDRRPAGRRTNAADEFQPPLRDVLTLTQRVRGALVKLAPSTRIEAELQSQIDQFGQRVWLGNQGECRQQLLLTGELRNGPLRQAVLCEPNVSAGADSHPAPTDSTSSNDSRVCEFSATCERSIRYVDIPQRYVFDLHNVLHAAELQAAWAKQHEMSALGDWHGYYTADKPLKSPWAQVFEVLTVLPWDDRQLRKWLRKYRAGIVEVKSRALKAHSINVDANASQRRYSAPEGEPLTLLVTRLGDRIRGVAARRVE